MKKKILFLIPLFLLLLTSSVIATNNFMTYDNTVSNIVGGRILGLTQIDDYLGVNMILTSSTRRIYLFDNTLTQVTTHDINQPCNAIAYDNNQYLYCWNNAINQVHKIDTQDNYTIVQSKSNNHDINAMTYFNGELIYLLPNDKILRAYDYNTATTRIINEYSQLPQTPTYTTKHGNNIVLVSGGYTLRLNEYYNIIEELKIINTTQNHYYHITKFNDFFVSTGLNSPQWNNLYFFTSLPPLIEDNVLINGVRYNRQQCITDSSGLSTVQCNNAKFNVNPYTNNVVAYCSGVDNIVECPTGLCKTTTTIIDGVKHITGSCDYSDCVNECHSVGQVICTGTSSYRVCGQYDSSECLKWSPVTMCDSGYICSKQGIGYCLPYNYESFEETFFSPDWSVTFRRNTEVTEVIPATTPEIAGRYTGLLYTGALILGFNSPPTKTLAYQHFNNKALKQQERIRSLLELTTVQFGVIYPNLANQNGLVSYDCDYKEEIITGSVDEEIITTAKVLHHQMRGSNSIVSLSYRPLTTNETITTLTLQNKAPSLDKRITINTTNEILTATVDNKTLASVEFLTGVYPTVIYLYCDTNFIDLFFSCKLGFVNSDGLEEYRYLTPIYFGGTIAPPVNNIRIETSEDVLLDGYKVSSIVNDRKGFTTVNAGDTPLVCQYKGDNPRILRVYQTLQETPNYLDFKDTYLFVETGEEIILMREEKTGFLSGLEEKLTTRQKYLVSIGISILIFILTLFLGSSFENSATATTIIGLVGGVSSFLFFVIIGWLPSLVAIVSFIIGGGVGAMFLRKQVVGA